MRPRRMGEGRRRPHADAARSPAASSSCKADLVLLAMGFLGPRRPGMLEQAGRRAGPARQRAANTVDYRTSIDQRVRRRRHAPRPVAGGVGDPRGPAMRPRGRRVPDGEQPVASLNARVHRLWIMPPRRPRHAAFEFRRLPRPASSDRRAPDVAVPPRPRSGRASRQARLRRILVRRASFQRLGNDRLAGDVPGRGGGTVEAHQAGDRRGVAALSPPVQRRAAHGAARPHDRRTGDLRLRPRRAGVRRAHARHRSDGAARPPGRGDRRHPPSVQRRAGHSRRASGSP